MSLFEGTLRFPQQNMNPISERMEKLLFLCFYDPSSEAEVAQSIAQLQSKSHYAITVFNLFEHHSSIVNTLSLSVVLDLKAFEGLIVHCSTAADMDFFKTLDNFLKTKLNDFTGIKLLISNKKEKNHTKLLKYTKKTTYAFKLVVEAQNTLDADITSALQKKKRLITPVFSSKMARKNVLMLVAHEPVKDPRLNWIVDAAPADLDIIQLGLTSDNSGTILLCRNEGEETFFQEYNPGVLNERLLVEASKSAAGVLGVQEFLELRRMLSLSEAELSEQYGAPYGSSRNQKFRWYLTYFLQVISVLVAQAVNIRGLHAIIASDLPTLSAALILKGLFNIPVFYDAHEYWPEQDVNSFEFEKQFWKEMEHRLLAQTDYCQTVSSTLADFMTEQYQKHFESVPNCLPLTGVSAVQRNLIEKNAKCRFIFQGGFAEGRGIELLIAAWPKVNKKAILLLRGPDGPYKTAMISLAKQTGLLDTRIFFLLAVHENDLVEALKDGDVGLIPYTPLLANNTNCCPNKLSQYLSARLPILSNDTKFIKKIIHDSEAGMVVDFKDRKALVKAVDFFVHDRQALLSMGEKGYQFFCECFHWEKVSPVFYQAIELRTEKMKLKIVDIFKLEPISVFKPNPISESKPSVTEHVSPISEPQPSTSEPQLSTSEPQLSISEPKPSVIEHVNPIEVLVSSLTHKVKRSTIKIPKLNLKAIVYSCINSLRKGFIFILLGLGRSILTLWRVIPSEGKPVLLSKSKAYFRAFLFFMWRCIPGKTRHILMTKFMTFSQRMNIIVH